MEGYDQKKYQRGKKQFGLFVFLNIGTMLLSDYILQEIVEKGLLISEYLPDTPPKPFRFPERNRILAGLSDIVIVTEAREKSGSLITANMALHENRDVYAVPGPITCDLSKGPNRLIEVGAIPIVDFKLEEPFQNIE